MNELKYLPPNRALRLIHYRRVVSLSDNEDHLFDEPPYQLIAAE